MSEQTTLFPEVTEQRKLRFLTHFYSKSDIMNIWGIQDHKQFETFIGEQGRIILDWKKGKQKFTPNQVREIISLVGKPLENNEYRG